jgi:rhamnosyltransferase
MYFPALACASTIVLDSKALESFFRVFARKNILYIPYQAVRAEKIADSLPGALAARIGQRPFLLVIARLEPENSIHEIISGWLPLRDHFSLVIVGSTSTEYYRKRLHKFAGEVVYTSAIYDQALLNRLRQSCAGYIHGHTVGGTNPSLLEAMMIVEAPIIASATAFNREVLMDGGVYFNNSGHLTEIISNLETCRVNRPGNCSGVYSPESIAESYLRGFLD